MNNEKWSQKPLITEISNTTEFCILDEAIPKNKRINAKALLDAKANSSTLSSHTSNTDNPHSVTKTQVGLGNVDNTSDASKPISIAQQIALDLKAPKENAAFTGTMTLNGNPVTTNDLNGSNYVMVYGVGNSTENAAELQAAYDEAKKMPRFIGYTSPTSPTYMYAGQTFGVYVGGSPTYYKILVDGEYTPYQMSGPVIVSESEAKSVRTTVIVAPGEYNFGASAFVVNADGIDIVSLTGNSDVIIRSTEYVPGFGNYGIKVYADYILIKGINCKTNIFYIESFLDNLICEYCIGGNYSFAGAGGTPSGVFNYCTGGNYSFGSGIGGTSGTASGTFNNCVGGEVSFGSNGTASGVFNNCIGDAASFGSYSGIVSGTFNNCIGGSNSFGDYGGTISGELINCKLTAGTFQTPTGEGKIYNSIDGNGNLVNYPPLAASSDLNGTNYLMVYGTGTPAENAAELNAAISESEKMPRYLGIKISNTPTYMYAGQTYGMFTGSYIYYKVLVDGTHNPTNIGSAGVVVTEAEAKSTSTTIIVAPSIINGTITPISLGVKLISLTGFHDVIINGVKSLGRNDIYDKSQTDILLSRKQDLLNSFNKLGRWNNDMNTLYFYLDLVGHLQYANFYNRTISGVLLDINFKYANFTGGALNNSMFNRSNFSYATFRNAALTNVNLTEANLTNANLTGIILSGVRLDRVNLSGATGLDADINIALTPGKYLLTSDTYLIWTDGKPYNFDIATGLLVYAPQSNPQSNYYYYYSIIGEI